MDGGDGVSQRDLSNIVCAKKNSRVYIRQRELCNSTRSAKVVWGLWVFGSPRRGHQPGARDAYVASYLLIDMTICLFLSVVCNNEICK